MQTTDTQAIVGEFLQFLTQRNLENLVGLFSEQVDWYIPGDRKKAPWLGRRNSREEVRQFYELLWESTEPLSAQIDQLLTAGNTAVITGDFSTKMLQTNKVVDSLFSIQLTVENGLIVRYRLLEDSYAVSVALTV
jgi:ketosteroid isomerase-like protein